MQLSSINIAAGAQIKIGSREYQTGIFKSPVESAVIETLGVRADVVADTKHHGGPDQAVYMYSAEDYAWWSAHLGREVGPGMFGDNLTVTTFGPEPVRIGDRFAIGPVALQVTAPRIPCATLATRMGDKHFVQRFRDAERPGVYLRVLTPGAVSTGAAVTRTPIGPPHPTVVDVFRLWYDPDPDPERLRLALAAPLAIRARAHFEKELET
jgi:MOSC domain-containing protein YiiM